MRRDFFRSDDSQSRLLPMVYVALVAVAPALLGCGQSTASYPSAIIEGAVTVAGKPLTTGQIQFIPKDGGRCQPGSAKIIDGRYCAEKVPLGKVTVMLRAARETGKIDSSYSVPIPKYENLIPEKYRNGIDLDVREDKSGVDFHL